MSDVLNALAGGPPPPARDYQVLVQVITGGRPRISQRPTARLFPPLREWGFTDIEWVVREDHAPDYEDDGNPLNVYGVDWASEFARTHWRHPTAQWEHGGFFGAFPGREWAMRTGKRRGYDLVLQLDDNVEKVGPVSATRFTDLPAGALVRVLCDLAMSTNAHMTGMQLASVVSQGRAKVIRPGFPYSVFVEKAQWGRMPYYGPFEDDIMHSLEYGLHGGENRTAAVVPTLTYAKESKSSSGMRKHYNSSRGLELPRRYPRNATLVEMVSTSSPSQMNGQKAYRHRLTTRGYTPVRVTDRGAYQGAADALGGFVRTYLDTQEKRARMKMAARAVKGGGGTDD